MILFFNGPAPTEIYTLSLHDALPIWLISPCSFSEARERASSLGSRGKWSGYGCDPSMSLTLGMKSLSTPGDRKSTRLNSSHSSISYAVFCLKKKNKIELYIQLNVRSR